jgi:acyl carrier protein
MITTELEERLQSVFRRVFRLDVVPEDASPGTIEDWDSLNHINLILEIELSFGINIDIREYAEMISYRAIVEILQERWVGGR